MFSIENANHSTFKLADYLEYRAIANVEGYISIASLRAPLAAPDDEVDIDGTEEGDDNVTNKLSEALNDCASRSTLFGNDYPFSIEQNVLRIKEPLSLKWYVYLFLLLANRLNMNQEKMQGGKDATKIFESLCQYVAKNYFGNACCCEVFGTSVQGSFKDKVEDLLQKLNIAGGFRPPIGSTGNQKDGGIDIVAWIPFGDNKDSQLIALGQCKTGSSWELYLKKSPFFDNFAIGKPMVEPLYMFFVAEYFNNHKWEERSRLGGILFDRFRIMTYISNNIEETAHDLLGDIKTWVDAAMAYIRQ